ncbi:MAG: uncharacterized protein QOC62_3509 [Mycobacterium sp.]|jgi:uncharacterized OB-fold protein|nr:uncharacterized protein [Mycobacterium sp.]
MGAQMTKTYLRPLPTITPENRPFWDALNAGKFVVPKCGDCGDYNWSPYPACRTCLSTDQPWVEVSGRGTVYTFTAVYRGLATFPTPHIWAYIELEEKPRTMTVLSNIIDCEPHDCYIGMPVEVVFEPVPGHDITLYKFKPTKE